MNPLKRRANKEFYEVWVMRTQPPGAEKSRDWELFIPEISTLESAMTTKDFLLSHHFPEDEVKVISVTWVATTITEVR
jgi:hypothetical protein